MENLFANRLTAARKMAGLSLQELSEKLGENTVSRQSLNKYEKGKMKPDSKMLIALANALGVFVDYFYTAPKFNIELINPEYRKQVSKITQTMKDGIEEKVKAVIERYLELEDILGTTESPDLFRFNDIISSVEFAEKAANKLREDWNLGNDPIPDVVKMLEDKGYKVVEIDAPEGFDGLTAIAGTVPVIALNKNKSDNCDIVRKRFTALHELAHLSFSFPDNMNERDRENMCHAFASAVLYPATMAQKELHKERFHFYEKELVIIKERWGLSISAVFSRAKQLGIINDYVYRKFNIGFKQRGYHIPGNEPGRFNSNEVPTRLESLVFLGLAKEVITINEAAYFADIPVLEIQKQLKQLV